MRGSRTQAERDAVTVEMMFAALTGAIFAALALAVFAAPVLAGQAHGIARAYWLAFGVTTAIVVFCGRVGLVLRRFERTGPRRELPDRPR
jgi:Na+/proline symporter